MINHKHPNNYSLKSITISYVMNRPTQVLGGSVNYFSVVHWNVQGILDKIDDLNMLNMKSDSDVCCICEHCLGAGELSDIAVPG